MSLASIYTEDFKGMFYFGNMFDVEEDGNFVVIHGSVINNLTNFIKKEYGHSPSFCDNMFTEQGVGMIRVHKFFIPELIYILNKGTEDGYSPSKFSKLQNLLIENTWYKDTQKTIDSAVDLNVLAKLGRTPLPHQLEFIRDVYWQRKTALHLNGYLLSLDTGLGKSTTSIMLKECLHKKHAIIIAPLTVARNVWPVEIDDTVHDAKIWTIADPIEQLNSTVDYIVINYEFIGKLIPLVRTLVNPKETMVIVDECHNFKDIHAKRTVELIELCKTHKFDDILLMSATPIKALGVECLPIFNILDKFYDTEVEDKLRKLCRYVSLMNELLCNRLGFIMFRKLKSEVLELPDKHEEELKVKIANGNDYTLDTVRKLVIEYTTQRLAYYKEHEDEYVKKMEDILDYYAKYCLKPADKPAYLSYRKMLTEVRGLFQSRKGVFLTPDVRELIQSVNQYENKVIIPSLPNNLKKDFRDAKSVYKYIKFKVLGEVIGNLLTRLRIAMTTDLIGKQILDIINTAEKRTILFSSYTDSLETAEQYCKRNKLNPMVIDGTNSKQVRALLDKFKADPSINPLIASTKVLSTGHTIVECNTVIFLNVPFRSVDYYQASDRVYRIGQDADVYIYKLILDTGSKPNLSTRMQDILQWSKEQFTQLIGDDGNLIEDMDDNVKDMMNGLNNLDESIFDRSRKLMLAP